MSVGFSNPAAYPQCRGCRTRNTFSDASEDTFEIVEPQLSAISMSETLFTRHWQELWWFQNGRCFWLESCVRSIRVRSVAVTLTNTVAIYSLKTNPINNDNNIHTHKKKRNKKKVLVPRFKLAIRRYDTKDYGPRIAGSTALSIVLWSNITRLEAAGAAVLPLFTYNVRCFATLAAFDWFDRFDWFCCFTGGQWADATGFVHWLLAVLPIHGIKEESPRVVHSLASRLNVPRESWIHNRGILKNLGGWNHQNFENNSTNIQLIQLRKWWISINPISICNGIHRLDGSQEHLIINHFFQLVTTTTAEKDVAAKPWLRCHSNGSLHHLPLS